MWEVKIDVINLQEKRIQLKAEHSVDGKVDFSHNQVGTINDPSERSAMMDKIKNEYLEKLDREGQVALFLAGLEDTAENALESWEATL